MNLIDRVNEINPEIEKELARIIEPDNDFVLMGYLTQWLEAKGYLISTAAISTGQWKGDIMLPDESIRSFSNLFKTSNEARIKLLLKAVEIYTKKTKKQ